MKQTAICRGYNLAPLISIISGYLIIAIPSTFAQDFSPTARRDLHIGETSRHEVFFTGTDTSSTPCIRPGYGLGERILFPPTCGFRDVWTLFYLDKNKEFSFAFPMSEDIWATGHWWRFRHLLVNNGVHIIGNYTTDLLGNVSGGKSQGFAYTDTTDIRVDLDMQQLVGWPGAHVWFSFIDRNGRDLSQTNIGNFFTVSQDWGTQTISYYSLYLDQNFAKDWWNLKVGRLATMDDFCFSSVYTFYVSGGINNEPIAFPESGYLSAYPSSTWGSRLRFNDKKHNLYAMFGVYQTTNRLFKPAYHGMDFSIRGDDGANLLWEIGWTPEFQPHPLPATSQQSASPPSPEWLGMPGNYKFGIYYTPWKNIPQFYPTKNTFYSYGFYWLFDQMVYQAAPGSNRGLILWAMATYSPQQNTAILPFQGLFGAIYTGLIPYRSNDQLVLALIGGTFSKNYASLQRAQGKGYPTYEAVVEIGYRINFSSFFYIQPDIQYVIRPGGTGHIPNALVIGAQIGCNF